MDSEWESVFADLPSEKDDQDLGSLAYFWREAVSRQEMSEYLQRTSYWSLRLMLAMDARRDTPKIAGYRFTAYGLLVVDQDDERKDFGVQHYAVLSEEAKEPKPLDPIVVGNRQFPVVVREVKETLHAPPTFHPQWGTAGCWSTSRKGSDNRLGPGVVTAKHVIARNTGSSPTIGEQIDLSNMSKGKVLDLGPDGIDAGLISTSEPPGNAPLSMMQYIAPGTKVTFEGAASRAHSTLVTQITDTRLVVSSLLPARAILAEPGLGGDSGALVWDSNNNTLGVGFYIGELRDPAGRFEGIAQNGYQVEKLMDMEFFL